MRLFFNAAEGGLVTACLVTGLHWSNVEFKSNGWRKNYDKPEDLKLIEDELSFEGCYYFMVNYPLPAGNSHPEEHFLSVCLCILQG